LGLPVEQVLAEMKGEAPPTPLPVPEPESPEAPSDSVEEVPSRSDETVDEPVVETNGEADIAPAPPTEAPEDTVVEGPAVPPPPVEEPSAQEEGAETAPAAAAVAVEEQPAPVGNGSGNGKAASVVTARPVIPPKGVPEGVRTQRLLTVVKARAIQTVKAEPTDKVNTWPHLMLMEFGALLAITGLLVIMSVVIHSPLLDPANFNATPNPSKAPWYFLGLQELLSYFDPQIAGVTVPTITGMIGFMMVPFVDKNPSTRPSDRKFAIALYSLFLAGAATLTIIGVLFRGRGFNFSYPWKDGVFFDDLKDWVHFE
jgi:hypothetical protein